MLMSAAPYAPHRYQYFHRVYPHVSSPAQSQLLDHYLSHRDLRPATVRSFRLAWRPWITFAGDVPAHEITPDICNIYRQVVLSRARPETWNSYLSHFRAVYNCAVKDKLIPMNPFNEIERAAVVKKPKKTVSLDILQTAMDKLYQNDLQTLRPQWFWRVVVQALYFTGMRRHQLIALRWCDVDFKAATLMLASETRSTHREWIVPLSAEWSDDLLDLRRRTVELLGRSEIAEDQVFNVTLFYSRYRGKKMTDEHLSGFFKRLSATIGETITAHQLRNTAATQLMRATKNDVTSVQKLLGHTDVKMTLEYIDTDIESLHALIKKIPKLRK